MIGTKKIVDDALKQCPDVRNVLVYKRTGADVPMTKGRGSAAECSPVRRKQSKSAAKKLMVGRDGLGQQRETSEK